MSRICCFKNSLRLPQNCQVMTCKLTTFICCSISRTPTRLPMEKTCGNRNLGGFLTGWLVGWWLVGWLVFYSRNFVGKSDSYIAVLNCMLKFCTAKYIKTKTSKEILLSLHSVTAISFLLWERKNNFKKNWYEQLMKIIISYKMLNHLSGGARNYECRYFRDEHTK